MAAPLRGTLHDFNPKVESPDDFYRRFRTFCSLNPEDFADEALNQGNRRRFFLLHLPPEVSAQLARSVRPTELDDLTLPQLLTALREVYQANEQGYTGRVKFGTRVQKAEENVRDFIRALNELITACDYEPAQTREAVLKDRLVLGVRSEAIRKRLMESPNLTYQQACELAICSEAIDKEAQFIAQHREDRVYKVDAQHFRGSQRVGPPPPPPPGPASDTRHCAEYMSPDPGPPPRWFPVPRSMRPPPRQPPPPPPGPHQRPYPGAQFRRDQPGWRGYSSQQPPRMFGGRFPGPRPGGHQHQQRAQGYSAGYQEASRGAPGCQHPHHMCCRCGKNHGQAQCPAFRSTCYDCHQKGHTAQWHQVHSVSASECSGPLCYQECPNQELCAPVDYTCPQQQMCVSGEPHQAPPGEYQCSYQQPEGHCEFSSWYSGETDQGEVQLDNMGDNDEAYLAQYYASMSVHDNNQYQCHWLQASPTPAEVDREFVSPVDISDEDYVHALTLNIASKEADFACSSPEKDCDLFEDVQCQPLELVHVLCCGFSEGLIQCASDTHEDKSFLCEEFFQCFHESAPVLKNSADMKRLCKQQVQIRHEYDVFSEKLLDANLEFAKLSNKLNLAATCLATMSSILKIFQPPCELTNDSVLTASALNSFCDINSLETVGSTSLSSDPLLVQVMLSGKCVKMEVDTGSALTLMHSSDFFQLFPSAELSPCYNRIRAVSGHAMQVEGRYDSQVSFEDRLFNLPLVVCSSAFKFTPLLGRDWMDVLFPSWRWSFEIKHAIGVHKVVLDDKGCNPEVEKFRVLYPNVFSNDRSLAIKGYKASIILKEGARPVQHKDYPVPYPMYQEVTDLYRQYIQDGHYIPVMNSKWASPSWPIRKLNGSVRIVIDYRKTVNPHIVLDYYPLPVAEDIFVRVGGCKIYTVLDLSDAYKQLELDEESREILTIVTHLGKLQPTRLQYGVASAPLNFQCVMDQLLLKATKLLQSRGHKQVKMAAYIDDIIIGAQSEEELKQILHGLFEVLNEHNVRINESKCQFFVEEIEYLGHRLNSKGVHTLEKRVRPIIEAPSPKNVSELRSFLGMVNFYRKFLPNLSQILYPLNRLLHKSARWDWSADCEAAFQLCKSKLLEAPLLTHYNPKLPILVSTDSSSYGMGGCLAHLINGEEKPVTFFSCSLSPAQQKYPALEKEALAITVALSKYFHKFIYGREFTLIIDSMPLTTIFTPSQGMPLIASMRIQHWAMILNAYTFTTMYRKSAQMGPPDTLSRLPLKEMVDVVAHVALPYDLPLNYEIIAFETAQDVLLTKVKEYILNGWPQTINDPPLKPYFEMRYALSTQDECVVFGDRVCVPGLLQQKVLSILHEAHPGANRMKMRAKQNVWWPNINGDIERYVANCEPCTIVNFKPSTNKTVPWPDTLHPWDRVHLDFFFWESNVFLLLIDSYSKWLEVWHVPNSCANTVIETLFDCFKTFGFPVEIVTDNGPPFCSYKFLEFCTENRITVTHSPPYHPQSNGLAERWVQTSKQGLRKLMFENPRLSIKHKICKFLMANRNTPCMSTNLTPAEVMLRYVPRTNLTALKPPSVLHTKPYLPKSAVFQPGDVVNVRRGERDMEIGTILRMIGVTTYLVQLPGGVTKVSVNQMKLNKAVDVPNPVTRIPGVNPNVNNNNNGVPFMYQNPVPNIPLANPIVRPPLVQNVVPPVHNPPMGPPHCAVRPQNVHVNHQPLRPVVPPIPRPQLQPQNVPVRRSCRLRHAPDFYRPQL